MRSKHLALVLTFATLLGASSGSLSQGSDVYVNGQRLSAAEVYGLQRELGTYIAPGSYLYDDSTGCWYNQSTGASGCLSGNGDYLSRYGSGSSSGQFWNHWSNAAGGGVGGTSDGCIYTTFGWSNC